MTTITRDRIQKRTSYRRALDEALFDKTALVMELDNRIESPDEDEETREFDEFAIADVVKWELEQLASESLNYWAQTEQPC